MRSLAGIVVVRRADGEQIGNWVGWSAAPKRVALNCRKPSSARRAHNH